MTPSEIIFKITQKQYKQSYYSVAQFKVRGYPDPLLAAPKTPQGTV